MQRVFAGSNALPELTGAQIAALSDSHALQDGFPGTYPISSDSVVYYYFSYPDSMGDATNFFDVGVGFPVSMATVDDDAAYSNVADGWSYAIVSVTVDATTSDYRLYRSQYPFSAQPLRLQVSGPSPPGPPPSPPSGVFVGSAMIGDTMGGFW